MKQIHIGQLQPVTLYSWNFYHVCMWHGNVISIYFPAGDLFISCCKSKENGMPWNHFSVQRNNSFQQFFDISTYVCQSILYCSENACPNTFNFFFSKTFVNVMTNALFLFEGFVVIVIIIIACFQVIQACKSTPWQFSWWETFRKSENLFNCPYVRNCFRTLQTILSIADSMFVV